MIFLSNKYQEGTAHAKEVIGRWKKISAERQELRDALEKIDFSSRPDGGKVTLENFPIVCPGRCVMTKCPSFGTIGSLCKINPEDNSFGDKLCAITCAHVVGTEDVECFVCTGQGGEKPASLGKSDVVIKRDDYRSCTLDITAIRVANETLRFEPFKSQQGIFVNLSVLGIEDSGEEEHKRVSKALIGRRVQKIGAKTNLTYGKVRDYYMQLHDEQNKRTLYNMIEVEWMRDDSGVKRFTQDGDSGAVVTDVLDGSVPNPCAIGIHIGRYENGDHASSICSPLQMALGALSTGLSHKYQQQLKVELLAPDSCQAGKRSRESEDFSGEESPPKRLC